MKWGSTFVIMIGILYVLEGLTEIGRSIAPASGTTSLLMSCLMVLGVALCLRWRWAIIVTLLSYPVMRMAMLLPESPQMTEQLRVVDLSYLVPFQHVTYGIMKNHDWLSSASPMREFLLWGLFALHAACLLPFLFRTRAEVVAVRKNGEKKRRGEFYYPDSARIYETNPLHVLGLLPYEVTMRTILSRRTNLRSLVNAGLEPKDKLSGYQAIPWPGAAPLTDAAVRQAYGQLEDGLGRIRAQMLWFHFPGSTNGSYASLCEGEFDAARQVWEAEYAADPQGYSGALALNNLAVLQHGLTLAAEMSDSPSQSMPRKQRRNWERSLVLWNQVCEHDATWEYFEKARDRLNDPRVNASYLLRLRRRLPKVILGVNLDIAKAAVAQNQQAYALQHLALVRKSPFDPKLLSRMEQDFVDTTFGGGIVRIHKELQADLSGGSGTRSPKKIAAFLDEAGTVFECAGQFGLAGRLDTDMNALVNAAQGPLFEMADERLTAAWNKAIGLLNGINSRLEEAIEAYSRSPREMSSTLGRTLRALVRQLPECERNAQGVEKAANDGIESLQHLIPCCPNKETLSIVRRKVAKFTTEARERTRKVKQHVRDRSEWLHRNSSAVG